MARNIGGLVIRIGAEAHLLDRAVQQTRALLQSLSTGTTSDSEAALAQQEFQQREDMISRSAAGRLTRLWLSGKAEASSPTPITAASLRSLYKNFSAENHRVVIVRRRK